MPPEGKVGVSPVCILGVNINRGQEVSLRLRTDDLKGGRARRRLAGGWQASERVDRSGGRARVMEGEGAGAAGEQRRRPLEGQEGQGKGGEGMEGTAEVMCPPACAGTFLPAHLALWWPTPPAGFRRYDRIRETLLHELAHMVHGDHDNAFKQLNSQVPGQAGGVGGGWVLLAGRCGAECFQEAVASANMTGTGLR